MIRPVRASRRVKLAATIVALSTGAYWYTSTPEVPQQVGYPFTSACRVGVDQRLHTNGGSGTLLAVANNQAIVLTVKHVAIRKGLPARARWGEQVCEGTVLAVHPTADLALLLVKAPVGIKPVKVAYPTDDGDPIYLVGYPGYDRATLRYQTGQFVEVDEDTLVVTCRPEEGMSGGPAFDRYGRVVGSVSAYGLQYGYCGSGKALIELLLPYTKK